MIFRQRIAWIAVIILLLVTSAAVYYVFEISEQFNIYAIDHIQKYHRGRLEVKFFVSDKIDVTSSSPSSQSLYKVIHILDIPIPILLLFLLVAYLQVFCMVLSFTKKEPRRSLAFTWPCRLVMVIKHYVTTSVTSGLNISSEGQVKQDSKVAWET